MVQFFSRPALPHPDDLCLIHTPPGEPPLFRPSAEGWWWRRRELPPSRGDGLFLGAGPAGEALWSLTDRPSDSAPWTPMIQLMGNADADTVKTAVRALELAHWQRDHQFCGRCGAGTVRRDDQVVLDCPACGSESWPRVSPAVIMLVHRDDQILLARNLRSTHGFHSTLAGFVESGETLEEAVAREVLEEVGVRVGQPRYVASQAWPFPHALMIGFHVPWVSGEPTPDGVEIAEAGWYRRDSLPNIPPPMSIAGRLIQTFLDGLEP